MAAASGVHVKIPTKDVQKLLTRYPVLVYEEKTNKVKCTLSGHEMPCKADAILSYVSGKKFLKLYNDKEFGYEKYKPHLVQSVKKREEHLLFCKLTLRLINKTPRDVMRHVNGRRYKKALERWQKCQETGETFKPFCRRKRNERRDTDEKFPDFLDSEDENKSDSEMSDLYPAKDFESPEDEDMEVLSNSDSDDQDNEAVISNGDMCNNNANDHDSSDVENDHPKPKKAKLSVEKKKKNKTKKK